MKVAHEGCGDLQRPYQPDNREVLVMIYGEKVLAGYGDDDGIPDLRDEDLEG